MHTTIKKGAALALTLLLLAGGAGCAKRQRPPEIPGGGAPGGDIPGMNGEIPEDGQMPGISYSKVEEVFIDLPNEAVSTGARIDGATLIEFEDASAAVTPENAGVTVEKGVVTVTKAGSYLLRGAFEGQLRVNTADEEEVTLYLDGLQIVSPDSAALYVLSAPKRVTISTLSGSKNILKDGDSYLLAEGSDEPSAALFSKEDLTLEGEGSLYVSSKSAKGIYSKDDLKIKSGNVFVTSGDDGIRGKDSLTVTGGQITLSSGTDGLKTSNDSEEGKGTLLISGGKITLSAGDDGIDAIGKITLSGGEIAILTGEGASSNTSGGGNDFGGGGGGGFGGGGGRPPRFENANASSSGLELTPLAATAAGGKGVKSDDAILILGCTLPVDAYDDALHATNSVEISGGTLHLAAGDDGIHADTDLAISGSATKLTITKSYEGIEATNLVISGGTISVTASDDGLTAAGGPDASSAGTRPGKGTFSASTGKILISGGTLSIRANGDGLDANGTLAITGGTITVVGPTSGDTAILDFDASGTISGGTFIGLGAASMAQNFSASSTQGVIMVTTGNQAVGTLVQLTDGSGNVLLSHTADQSFACVILSHPSITQGGTYTLTIGDSSTEITMTSTVYGGSGGMGGGKGKMGMKGGRA